MSGLQHATTTKLLALPAAMRNLPGPLRLSEDDAVMLAAMVAGDRTYLTHSLRVGFERTGSFHMLVVSGFHLAIVAACIFWVGRRLRLPRVPATFLTIAAAFAYALFTGFATPVERSLWMVTLYLLGRLIYRERSPLNTIGFAALCLLVVSPRSLFDSSLQMTLLAVIVIAGVAAPLLQGTIHPYAAATRDLRLVAMDIKLTPKLAEFRVVMRMIAERLERAGNSLIAWRIFPWSVRFAIRMVELVVVSCVVELAMALPDGRLLPSHYHLRFAGKSLHLAAAGCADAGGAAHAAGAGRMAGGCSGSSHGGCAGAALRRRAGAPVRLDGVGDFRIPGPLLWQSAAFCVLLGFGPFLPGLSLSPSLSSMRRWLRRAAWAALVLAALAAVVPRPVDRPRGAMLMEAIDVGQGDSLLVITPDGKTLLIDGGGIWRRAKASAAGLRYRRGGGLSGAVGARHPASGRGGVDSCTRRPHWRTARGAPEFSSR